MSGLVEAIGFLTPLGGARPPTERAQRWFPVVGAMLGAALGGVWWGAGRLWPAVIAALIAVVADAALTGMLHLDGIIDCADGLIPHLTRARRLEVMAQPDVGAFGAVVGGLVLLARVLALAVLAPNVWLLVALWTASRSAMVVVMTRVRRARPGGLSQAFAGGIGSVETVVGVIGSVAIAVAWRAVGGPVAVVAGLAAGALLVAVAVNRLGGFTGDVLGATGVLIETVGLVVAAAKW